MEARPAARQQPQISWDTGSAYDLFVSLAVLHSPDDFGLRASWAAGVRSRLPAAERKVLEDLHPSILVPMHWIYTLPAPKDAAAALEGVARLPAAERLPALLNPHDRRTSVTDTLRQVAQRGSWSERDLEALRSGTHKRGGHTARELSALLDCWAQPAETGELYLSALQAYVSVFFAEEEKRIAPALHSGLEEALRLAEKLPLADLLERLSRGVHFDEGFDVPHLTLAPTYWSTPLIFYTQVATDRVLVLFGVRPEDQSLVPGEGVPDALLQALKALADPTRLRILRYLAREALTPSELSRRLRLRAPTVTHHLKALRLAGLVHLSIQPDGERRYAARLEGIQSTAHSLDDFLTGSAADQKDL